MAPRRLGALLIHPHPLRGQRAALVLAEHGQQVLVVQLLQVGHQLALQLHLRRQHRARLKLPLLLLKLLHVQRVH